jgi:hypothetical protein
MQERDRTTTAVEPPLMSRLQGWTAFDGLPGPDQVAAGGPAESAGSIQQQNSQQSQQQAQRFSPLAPVSNNNMNLMGSGPGPLRMQQPQACPPRPAPVPEGERFLKPVENQDPNPSQHQQQQQQQLAIHNQQSASAPHSPPQQQRAMGSNVRFISKKLYNFVFGLRMYSRLRLCLCRFRR